MFGTEPTCVAVCPRPAGDGVPVLRHHTGHHTVLQLLPAEFLDALHPGHGHGRRPAAAPAQVQVSARRRTNPNTATCSNAGGSDVCGLL